MRIETQARMIYHLSHIVLYMYMYIIYIPASSSITRNNRRFDKRKKMYYPHRGMYLRADSTAVNKLYLNVKKRHHIGISVLRENSK